MLETSFVSSWKYLFSPILKVTMMCQPDCERGRAQNAGRGLTLTPVQLPSMCGITRDQYAWRPVPWDIHHFGCSVHICLRISSYPSIVCYLCAMNWFSV